MAVKRGSSSARSGRKVTLARSGGSGTAAKNSRHEIKVKKVRKIPRFSLPWRGIGYWLSTSVFLCTLVVFLAGISLGLMYGYRYLTTSEYFSLTTLEIQGNFRLDSREILKIADLEEGANTLALSIDAIEDALSLNPWVENVSVKRVLPGSVIIQIKEREPAFWQLHNGRLQYTDARGKRIAPVVPGKFASLPTLEVEAGAEDREEALPDLLQSLREFRLPVGLAAISQIRLSASRGLEIYLEDRRLRISIGLEDWLPNLNRLIRTLADLDRRGEMPAIREIRVQGNNVWVEKFPGSAAGA